MEYCLDFSELVGIIVLSALVTGVIYQAVIRIFKKGKFKK